MKGVGGKFGACRGRNRQTRTIIHVLMRRFKQSGRLGRAGSRPRTSERAAAAGEHCGNHLHYDDYVCVKKA